MDIYTVQKKVLKIQHIISTWQNVLLKTTLPATMSIHYIIDLFGFQFNQLHFNQGTILPLLLLLFQLYFHFSLGQHLFTELSLVWLDLASPPTSPTKFSWTISLSQSPDFCQISRISTGICFRLGLILATRQTLSENIISIVSGLDEQISRLSE